MDEAFSSSIWNCHTMYSFHFFCTFSFSLMVFFHNRFYTSCQKAHFMSYFFCFGHTYHICVQQFLISAHVSLSHSSFSFLHLFLLFFFFNFLYSLPFLDIIFCRSLDKQFHLSITSFYLYFFIFSSSQSMAKSSWGYQDCLSLLCINNVQLSAHLCHYEMITWDIAKIINNTAVIT